MSESNDDILQQLADLNGQIAELGGEVDEAYRQVGGEEFGAEDTEDTAAALTMAQENEAILQPLYAKRERLQAQLKD